MSSIHRRDTGFTLVEIMIALGLFAGLAFVISTLLFSTSKQQSRIQTRAEVFEFQQQILLDLRSKPLPSPSP